VHSAEMRHLFAHSTLQPPENPVPTFPSWKPRRALDHILVSPEIRIEKVWTLPQAFSDHLALAAEIQLPTPPASRQHR
jgi:endonuclease/exonuclease/phosphatase family metal-dependent hydrolase